MAITNNKFLPLIFDGIDMMVAENQRMKMASEQRQKEQDQAERDRQKLNISNKSGFLKAILGDKSATPETKSEASSLFVQSMMNPDTDLSGFKPEYTQPEVKDPVIDMPADVRKYYPSAPEKAPQSVVKMFMDNARMIRNNELDAETTRRGQDNRNSSDDKSKLLTAQLGELSREMNKYRMGTYIENPDAFGKLENMRLALITSEQPLGQNEFSAYMNANRGKLKDSTGAAGGTANPDSVNAEKMFDDYMKTNEKMLKLLEEFE